MLNKYGFVALILAMSMAFSDYAEAAKRRVVVEDHTGAWCQFCPRGSVTLRNLLAEFGEDFIPVQIHNGDQMVNEYQQGLAQAIGLSGYPGGTVDRAYRGQGTSDLSWDPRTRERIGQEVPLDVDVEYSIEGGILEATVTVTADQDYNQQFAVNLLVMEDGVTGNGTGWDQVNAFNNQQGHPYYQKGNPVQNYIHDNVVWKYVGGPWGTTEGTPMSLAAGESYQKTFTWALSEESRIQNPENIWVIGLAQEINQGEFLNAKMDGKTLPYRVGVAAKVDQYMSQDINTTETQTLVLTNAQDEAISVELSLSENNFLPQGWTVDLSSDNVTIPAGGSIEVPVEITTNSNYGLAWITVETSTADGQNFNGVEGAFTFYDMANGTKNAFYTGLSSNSTPAFVAIASNTTIAGNFALMPGAVDAIEAYDPSQFEVGFFFEDFQTRGTLSSNGAYAGAARAMLAAGKSVFMTSTTSLFIGSGNVQGNNPSANFSALISDIGITTNKIGIIATQSGNQISLNPVPVIGEPGDPVGNNVNLTLNQYNQESHPYYSQFVDIIQLTSGSMAEPILTYGAVNNPNGPIAQGDIAGVKAVIGEGKIVYTGFSLDLILDQTARQTFFDQAYEWLTGEVQAGSPLIEVTNTHDFGLVDEQTTEEITIQNKGDATLMFAKIDVANDANNQFLFDDTTYPVDGIEPGGSANIKVTYLATTEGVSTADLVIESSDGNNDATVKMSGETPPSSVTNAIENVLSMDAIPNTFETETNLNINVVGTENVTINLIDINGVIVSNIHTGTLSGAPTLTVNAAGLSAGKYFIVANVDGQIARVPVIVEK